QAPEAEDLESAGDREDGAVPAHEAVQAAVRSDDVRTRAEHQVERVDEHDLGSELIGLLGRHPLHGAIGPAPHERWRTESAVRTDEPADARGTVAGLYGEFGSHRASGGITNMASP